MNEQKGKLIVIEGIDGAGKTVQWNMLTQKLESTGYEVETVDFPQYGRTTAAIIDNYLVREVYGKAMEVSPYAASVFYAIDRFDLSFRMHKWLKKGKILVSNRYVSSNGGHQGGKITDSEELKEFLHWLYDLEYNKFGIPKPDINVFLDIPLEISEQLTEARGKRDAHESDKDHLANAYRAYHAMIKEFPNDFAVIGCVENGRILPPEKIHESVWKVVSEKLGL
ncbi:MAG: thymidylate kinase [Patescibacteria group bacterium]